MINRFINLIITPDFILVNTLFKNFSSFFKIFICMPHKIFVYFRFCYKNSPLAKLRAGSYKKTVSQNFFGKQLDALCFEKIDGSFGIVHAHKYFCGIVVGENKRI